MSNGIKREIIDNYEEDWQKQCYFPSGGIYVHCCEICKRTSDVDRITGGHFLCGLCKKKMRLPKKATIIKWGLAGLYYAKKFKWKDFHPSTPALEAREKIWKRVIYLDYCAEMHHKNFKNGVYTKT